MSHVLRKQPVTLLHGYECRSENFWSFTFRRFKRFRSLVALLGDEDIAASILRSVDDLKIIGPPQNRLCAYLPVSLYGEDGVPIESTTPRKFASERLGRQ